MEPINLFSALFLTLVCNRKCRERRCTGRYSSGMPESHLELHFIKDKIFRNSEKKVLKIQRLPVKFFLKKSMCRANSCYCRIFLSKVKSKSCKTSGRTSVRIQNLNCRSSFYKLEIFGQKSIFIVFYTLDNTPKTALLTMHDFFPKST